MENSGGSVIKGAPITGDGIGAEGEVSLSVSVHILANNAIRAHHASAHGGLSANVLSDIV